MIRKGGCMKAVVRRKEALLFQFAADPRHLATSYEVASELIKVGHTVNLFWWGNTTSFIQKNSAGFSAPNILIPKLLKLMNRKMYEYDHNSFKFNKRRKLVPRNNTKLNSNSILKSISHIKHIDELSEFKFKDLPIGAAISNALVSYTKERYPNLDSCRKLIRLFVKDYLSVFESVVTLISDRSDPENLLVYVFNGRFLHEKAAADAAKFTNVGVKFYEVIRDRYLISDDGFHDREILQERVLSHWDKSTIQINSKLAKGGKYFSELKSEASPFYAADRQLQPGLKKGDYFIYYTSSDDEYVGWWGSQILPLGDQLSVIQQLQQMFDQKKKHKLLVKIHPNLLNKGKNEISRWDKIVDTDFSIVERGKKIDPLLNSLGVMSFGSTAGLEASYWRIPSAVLAPCGYDLLGAVWKFDSWQLVSKWIDDDEFRNSRIAEHRLGALKRGYYIETAGTKYNLAKFEMYAAGAYWLTKFGDVQIKDREIKVLHKIYFAIKRTSRGLGFR